MCLTAHTYIGVFDSSCTLIPPVNYFFHKINICIQVILLFVIALFSLTRFTASDYLFGIFWLPLWYLLITSLVFSDYPFGIFWLPLWYLLITSLVSSDYLFGIFWLPIWYLLITSLVSSDYLFGIFWLPLWYLPTFLSNC